jgi:hypothetical protein
MGWESMGWINVVQDRGKWQAVVFMVAYLPGP